MSLKDCEEKGKETFTNLYGGTAQGVQTLLDDIYPDMGMCQTPNTKRRPTLVCNTGWFSNTIGYGLVYGFTDVLSLVETSYTLVTSLISVDTAQQIAWHLANAQRAGATLEEVRAVREIAMEVGRKAGVEWRNGVPEVEE